MVSETTSIFPKISMKAARVNANLSQEKAAEKLNISRATLQNYENGVTVPSWDVVERMEEVYHFPISFISFGKNSLKA